MGQNGLHQYSWNDIHYPLLVFSVNQPNKGELVALPVFYNWFTGIRCREIHSFVYQQPKIAVGLDFSHTRSLRGGCPQASCICVNSRTTAGCEVDSKSDVSGHHWLLLCSIDPSNQSCCHCQQLEQRLPTHASHSMRRCFQKYWTI